MTSNFIEINVFGAGLIYSDAAGWLTSKAAFLALWLSTRSRSSAR